jgi:hypothetical protein
MRTNQILRIEISLRLRLRYKFEIKIGILGEFEFMTI